MWQKFSKWRRSARAREVAAYDAYSGLVNYPLFVMSLLFMIAFAITLTPTADEAELRFAHIVIPVTWAVFAVDYALGILMSPKRWEFARTHWAQALALLFPPLRMLMLYHVFSVLRAAPIRRGDRARIYVLYVTTLLLVFCAVLVVYFERKSPDANITSFGDALWWGGETVSTVGYGDFYPVTMPGRLIAAVLFVNGVALISVITAGLAQNFTADDAKKQAQSDAQDASQGAAGPDLLGAHIGIPNADLAELHRRLAAIEEALADVAAHVTAALSASMGGVPAAEVKPDNGPPSEPRRVGSADAAEHTASAPSMGDSA
jgi:voltage-gated potassium channel